MRQQLRLANSLGPNEYPLEGEPYWDAIDRKLGFWNFSEQRFNWFRVPRGNEQESYVPQHDWVGTSLRWANSDGTLGEPVDLRGPVGDVGIYPEAEWDANNVPYRERTLLFHKGALWFNKEVTSEEPGTGDDWFPWLLLPDTVVTALENANVLIDDLTDRIDNADTVLAGMQAVAGEIEAYHTDLTAFTVENREFAERFEELNALYADARTEITTNRQAAQTAATNTTNALTAAQTLLATSDSLVADAQTQVGLVNGYRTEISNARTDTLTAKGLVDQAETRINAKETTYQTYLTQANDAATRAEQARDAAEDAIDLNNYYTRAQIDTKISGITTDLGELETDLNTLRTQTNAISTRIDNLNAGQVAETAGRVYVSPTQRTQIDTSATDVANLKNEFRPAQDIRLQAATDIVAVTDYVPSAEELANIRKYEVATSWYNETLNTTTRGARREFPENGLLIVIRAGQVALYERGVIDTAGNLVLWKILQRGTAYRGWTPLTCAEMVNGWLYVGSDTGTTTGELYVYDFLADSSYYRQSSVITTPVPNNLASSAINNHAITYINSTSGGIVSERVRSISTTIRPDAPLDSYGRRVPTIAVATDAGLSVIHPNGSVYDVTVSGGYSKVAFTSDGRLRATRADALFVGPIPTSDLTEASWGGYLNTSFTIPRLVGYGHAPQALIEGAVGSGAGFTVVEEGVTPSSLGMTAHVTKDYATGHMIGDTKTAILCDAATGTIGVAPTLFDNCSSATNWTSVRATVASVNGKIEVTSTNDAIGYPVAQRNVSIVAGQSYILTADLERIAGRGSPSADVWVNGVRINGSAPSVTGSVTVPFTAPAGATIANILIGEAASNSPVGLAARVDNLRIERVTAAASFYNDAEGFSAGNGGSISVENGELVLASGSLVNPSASRVFSGFVVGQTYEVVAKIRSSAGPVRLQGYDAASAGFVDTDSRTLTSAKLVFTAVSTNLNLAFFHLISANNAARSYVDEIVVRQVIPDRSGSVKPWNILGTLQRTTIGSGDAVGYSGFTEQNHLVRSYDADLDVGTGNFQIDVIVSNPPAGNRNIFSRQGPTGGSWGDTGYIVFGTINQGSAGAQVRFICGNASSTVAVEANADLSGRTARLTARRMGNVFSIWIDGKKIAEQTVAVGSLGSTTWTDRLGILVFHQTMYDGLDTGKISMFRFSKTAASDAQIVRAHREELNRLSGNGYIGGNSSDVLSLDRDPITDELAVATPLGVSVFTGLRLRTYLTASGTAITSNNTKSVSIFGGDILVGTVAEAAIRMRARVGELPRPSSIPETDRRYLGKTEKATDSTLLNGRLNTTTSGGGTIVQRSDDGDITARLFRSEFGEDTGVAPNWFYTAFETGAGTNNYLRPTSVVRARNALIPTYSRIGIRANRLENLNDWNSAIENGFYSMPGAANAPEVGNWFLGTVEAHEFNWITQTVHRFEFNSASDQRRYRRQCKNGTWGAWYRLYDSEAELDARYTRQIQLDPVDRITTRPVLDIAPVEGSTPRGWTINRGETAPYLSEDRLLKTAQSHAPRVDFLYGGASWIIDRTSTNLFLWSENFDHSAWGKGNITVSPNAAIAPDGMMTADLVVDNVNNGQHVISQGGSTTGAVGYKGVISVFAKAKELAHLQLTAHAEGYGRFDLTNGTCTTTGPVVARIEKYPNDWFRCSVAITRTFTGNNTTWYMLLDKPGFPGSYVGNGSGLYLWGAQLEEGNGPSSYIPTTLTAVARGADRFYRTVSTDWNQNEGGIYIRGKTLPQCFTYDKIWMADDTSYDRRFELFRFPDKHLYVYVQRVNGSAVFQLDLGVVEDYADFAVAFGWKDNDFAAVMKGGTLQTFTNGLVPRGITIERLGLDIGGPSWAGRIEQYTRYYTKPSNTELVTLVA